jgi:hypothetical protein
MQPGQTSSFGGSSGGSSASYTDSKIVNQRRRMELLIAEAPELDFATQETLSRSASSDADMVQMARGSVSFASRENTVNTLKAKSNKEQLMAWEKMSESRKQFLVDAGYTIPVKKRAQWVSWWEYPQHYAAEYVAKGWDISGFDSIWKNTGGKIAGPVIENAVVPALGVVANAADDVAGRFVRAAYDSLGQNELARWQIGMEATRTKLEEQGMNLSEEQWQQVLWRYTENNLGDLNFLGSSNTNVNMTGQAARFYPGTMFGVLALEGLSAIPGLGFLENIPGIQETQLQSRKVNPYAPSVTGADVDDETYDKFSAMAETVTNMEQFQMKSIVDIWNRVDNGIAVPTEQLRILRENFGNDYNTFDIALWESEGKSLDKYLTEKENLDPSTIEFKERFSELQTNTLSKTDYKNGLNRLKSDNAKISLGRIAARGLGIMNVPYLGDLVSGTVDGFHVVVLDPLNLLGPAVKTTRFARFGISAKEIAAARAFDSAVNVTRTGKVFTVKELVERSAAGELGSMSLVKIFTEADDIQKFSRAQKLLSKSEKLTTKLKDAGIDLEDGVWLVDGDGMPTPWLLDNWEILNQIFKDTSDDLLREVMGRTGRSPEDVANLVQRRAVEGLTKESADEAIGIFNQLEALDYAQQVLRRTEKPVIDLTTGSKTFNWLAKSSLGGTQRWMDRVVQAFVEMESATDLSKDALTRLANDLIGGRKVVATLADYHALLKSRGLKGITSRDDIWAWLESAALYHMNVGEITGQISRGFGNGIKLPSQWRVFARVADTVPMLENRASVGMLPRLSKGGARRRRLINKTESALYAITARKENEALLKRLGMYTPRSAAKVLFSLSHQIPQNSYLNLTGDDAVVEFGRLLDYGFFAGVDKAVLDEFMEQFIRGTSSGTRLVSGMSRTQINQRLDSLIGMVDETFRSARYGEVPTESAQYAIQTALESHPIIVEIRNKLGISEPFAYRATETAETWNSLARPTGAANAFEWGWSDEVIERWDEVREILDQPVYSSVNVAKDILNESYKFIDDLNTSVANYVGVYADDASLRPFIDHVGTIANDMGFEADEIIELHQQYLRDLFNDTGFRNALRENLATTETLTTNQAYLRAALDAYETAMSAEYVDEILERFVNEAQIKMITENAVRGLEPLSYQNAQDMLTETLLSYRRESIFNSSTATRIMVEKQFLHELFNKAGMYTTETGREWVDDFLGHLANFRYAPNGEDEFALKTLSGEVQKIRVGVLPYSHRSRAMAIPSFQKFVDNMDKIGLTGRFTRRLNRSFLDSAMTQIWKPLTLMRLGFIPRAAGEEYLAFYARRGIWAPMASIASNVGPDRRGAILGSINHIGSLPSRVIGRLNQKGWGGSIASVSEVLKFKNQADFMAYMTSIGRVIPRRLDSSLKGNIVNAALDLKSGVPVAISDVVDASLLSDYAKYAGRLVANNFDYLRVASEYHTAKVAASIKKFNFSKLPQNLQRAILAEMGMTGRAEFADELGLVDQYAVTAALRDDADKLLRTAYMQQAHADAQAGVGGMIADPVIKEEAEREVIRLKRGQFSKEDDIVVEVRADRDWVSVDPTQLQDDGLYLAAGQQGSLIDNDPIAMEAVRTLANRIGERRLALNYRTLQGTQWDTQLMEVLSESPTHLELADRLIQAGSDPKSINAFIVTLNDSPDVVIKDLIISIYEDPRYLYDGYSSNVSVLEQRILVSTYLNNLSETELDNLYRNFSETLSNDDKFLEFIDDNVNPRNWEADDGGDIGIWMEDLTDDEIQKVYDAEAIQNRKDNQAYAADESSNLLDQLRGITIKYENEAERLKYELYDPFNPQLRDNNLQDEFGNDVIDNEMQAIKQRLTTREGNLFQNDDGTFFPSTDPGNTPTYEGQQLLTQDPKINEFIANPEYADSFGNLEDIRQMENAIAENDPLTSQLRGEDPFPDLTDAERAERGIGKSDKAIAEEAAVAQEFFDSHIFRTTNSPDQFYIDADGNLHLRSNKSGRNSGDVISTGAARTEDFSRQQNTVTQFQSNWTSDFDDASTNVIAIDRESVKSISAGAGADNPGNRFEIELLVNSTGEVIVPKGKWKIFVKPEGLPNAVGSNPLQLRLQARLDRSILVDELRKIVEGTLDQSDSFYLRHPTTEMQRFINAARVRRSVEQIPVGPQIERLNTQLTLQQFETVRSTIQNLPAKNRRLLEAAMQADQIAAGKSLPDMTLANYDLTKLHPEIRHQVDYMPEGSNYAKALKEALDLSQKGDNLMLEILQVLTSADRDVAQLLLGRNPLQLADEAADIVAAESAVLRALQSPEHAAVVNDSFLAMFDEASGLGVASPVSKSDRPIYSVMVDTWTAQWVERMLGSIRHAAEDMRGLDTILNMLRVKGASDDDLELVQRVILGFDPIHVSGQVQASNRIYRSTMVPISTTAFTNVQDAQRVTELLTGLSPAAGEYRPYLGFGSRPDTNTYAKVGATIVPADNGNILNAVYSDDLRTLTFEPNYQHNIDRVAPLAEAENLIYYDDLGNVVPAGQFAVEGVPQEVILREYARRIVSTVLGFVQSREGRLLHELIGPMDRGVWGVDAMYHVPKSELPSRVIYRTPYVAPATGKLATPMGRWAEFVGGTFERMNKAIFSISRAPQFILGLADGLAMAREVTDVWRKTELDDAFDVVMRELNPTTHAELQQTLVRETRRDLQNSWAMIGEAATSELNDGAELVDELLGLVSGGRLDPNSPLLEMSDEQMQTAFEWIRMDHNLERLEMQRGLDRAVAETVPYIDDHNVRSFFQVYAKNIFPFQFAQEAFLKRWARTVIYSPESFRRVQLLVHSLQSSGFVHDDPVSGKMTFNFPLTESLEDLIQSNPAFKHYFGDAAKFPIANPLTGKVENVLPGVPSDFQNLPQASPIAMVPLVGLAAHFPEIKPLVSQLSGGRAIDTASAMPTIETILSQWVPANYLRIVTAVTGKSIGFTGSELHQASISAMAQMESEAIRLRAELETVEDPEEIAALVEKINLLSLPDDADDVEIQQHMDEVNLWARFNMMFRAVLGWASPTAPKNEFEGIELSREYGQLLQHMSAEEAVAAFLTEHPNAQPWSIFQTEKTTAAQLAPTDRALNWMNENREFMDTYALAGPWFMPQSQATDEYSQQAYVDMVAAGMKKFKMPIEWYKDMKYAAAANIYFPSKVRKDDAIEAAVSSSDKKNIENTWTLWDNQFKLQHPIFANMLNEGINNKSSQTLNELHDLLILDNSELPKSDHVDEMRTMVQGWKNYDASMARIKGLSSKDIRQQRESLRMSFLMWGHGYAVENPAVQSMWNSLVLPATDLISESRSLFGKDN